MVAEDLVIYGVVAHIYSNIMSLLQAIGLFYGVELQNSLKKSVHIYPI